MSLKTRNFAFVGAPWTNPTEAAAPTARYYPLDKGGQGGCPRSLGIRRNWTFGR